MRKFTTLEQAMADTRSAVESSSLYLEVVRVLAMEEAHGSSGCALVIEEETEDFAGEAGVELASVLGRPEGAVSRIPGCPGWLEVQVLANNETLNTYFVPDDGGIVPADLLDFLRGEVEEDNPGEETGR
jgi:hypothetical protein